MIKEIQLVMVCLQGYYYKYVEKTQENKHFFDHQSLDESERFLENVLF